MEKKGTSLCQKPLMENLSRWRYVESLQNNQQISKQSSEICSLLHSKWAVEQKWSMEYLKTCCFSKNVAFNTIVAFWQGQEYHGPDIWQKYKKFVIDILDFADTPMYLLYLCIKKYIIVMIPSLLKQWLRQNQHFGRLASKSSDHCRENTLDCYNANKFINKDGSVSTKVWE